MKKRGWMFWALIAVVLYESSLYLYEYRTMHNPASPIPGGVVYDLNQSLYLYDGKNSKPLRMESGQSPKSGWYLRRSKSDYGIRIAYLSLVSAGQTGTLGTMRIDDRSGTVKLSVNPHLLGKIDYIPDWEVHDGRLFRVAGQNRHVKLHCLDEKGNLKTLSLPDLPSNVPVMDEWDVKPSMADGKSFVFEVPSKNNYDGTILLANTAKGTYVELAKGNGPRVSPDHKKLAFYHLNYGIFRIGIEIMDMSSRRCQSITIWRPVHLMDIIPVRAFAGRPATMDDLAWVPNGRQVICEVIPWWTYEHFLFAVDVESNRSCRLPFLISPGSWDWLPLDRDLREGQ